MFVYLSWIRFIGRTEIKAWLDIKVARLVRKFTFSFDYIFVRNVKAGHSCFSDHHHLQVQSSLSTMLPPDQEHAFEIMVSLKRSQNAKS